MSAVTMPLAEAEAMRDRLASMSGRFAGSAVGRDIQNESNLLNEAISAERDHGTDYQALLAELVERVGLYTGANFVATADEHGTAAALAALEAAVQCVAPPVDDRDAWLSLMREATTPPQLTVHATLLGHANRTTAHRPTLEVNQWMPVAAVPRMGESVVFASGERGRVDRPPEHGPGPAVSIVATRIDAKPKPKPDEELQAEAAE